MHFQPIQFGGRIRKLRREHHLTQERLAVMLNISVEHLRKIELGKRGISIDLLLDLSNVLEASLDFLLKGQLFQSSKHSIFVQSILITAN